MQWAALPGDPSLVGTTHAASLQKAPPSNTQGNAMARRQPPRCAVRHVLETTEDLRQGWEVSGVSKEICQAFAGELGKADSTLLAVRAQRACTREHGCKMDVCFISCLDSRAGRGIKRGLGRGAVDASASPLGTRGKEGARRSVGDTLAIGLCSAGGHLLGPGSCQQLLRGQAAGKAFSLLRATTS